MEAETVCFALILHDHKIPSLPVLLLLLCFPQERGGETFCSVQKSCRETECGVTHYMLCEVMRQLCYRGLVLGLVQCPADYLAWRTMSRAQALPQRGQGSKDTGFFSLLPKTYKLYYVPAVRDRRGGERGVDMPLSSLCSFHVALQRHDVV